MCLVAEIPLLSSINNEFTHETKWVRKNVFSRAVMMSRVRDNNPHTNTSSYLVFQKQAPRNNVAKIGFGIAGFLLGVFVAK